MSTHWPPTGRSRSHPCCLSEAARQARPRRYGYRPRPGEGAKDHQACRRTVGQADLPHDLDAAQDWALFIE